MDGQKNGLMNKERDGEKGVICLHFTGLAGQPSLRPGGTGGMVGIDLTSENAVKISGDLGNLFDDSEEEEDLTKV